MVIKLADGGEIVDEIAVADAHPLGARPFARDAVRRRSSARSPSGCSRRPRSSASSTSAQRLPELGPDELGGLTITAAPGALVAVEIPTGLF